MGKIEKMLKEYGPMLSGELALILEQRYSMNNDAARQAISRARTPVQKIKVFPFNKNQVFCYLEEQYNTHVYKEKLYKSLREESASISPILHALEESDYVMKKNMLPIYSKSPVENTKGHRSFDRIISDLLEKGVINEIGEEYYAISPMFSGEDYNITYSKGKEQVCKIAVADFISWASKLNIVAYNSCKEYPEDAVFAHFKWFTTTPSYISPLYNNTKGTPGFVVVDCVFKAYASVEDVKFFVDKVNIIRNFKGLPLFAPVLLTNGVSEDALQFLKNNKIVVAILSNLFSERYVEVLIGIYNLLRNTTVAIMNDPDKIDSLIEEIANTEGKFNNAAGALFECMVGLFFHRLGVNCLELNKTVPDENGKRYEMDVMADRDGRINVIECKAWKGRVDVEYVKNWISSRIPVFRKYILEIYPSKSVTFGIWSLSGFDEDAKRIIEEHNNNTSKYEIYCLDKKEMIELAKKNNDNTFCRQLNYHFNDYGVE